MNSSTTTQDLEAARLAVLRQADSLADWISGECMGATQIKERPLLRDKTAEDFSAWPVSWLLSLAFDAGQPVATRTAALDAISQRYLADDDVQAEQIRVANSIATQRAEDEKQDREEHVSQFRRVMDYSAAACR